MAINIVRLLQRCNGQTAATVDSVCPINRKIDRLTCESDSRCGICHHYLHRIAEAAALISVAAQTLNLTIPHVDEKLEFAYLLFS